MFDGLDDDRGQPSLKAFVGQLGRRDTCSAQTVWEKIMGLRPLKKS